MARANSLMVVLDGDFSNEALDRIKAAIGMVKGVIGVEDGLSDLHTVVAEMKVRNEIRGKLFEALKG